MRLILDCLVILNLISFYMNESWFLVNVFFIVVVI